MDGTERLRILQKCGAVPTDADLSDWKIAQATTWWGKPLDPTNFWKGRTVWCDASAQAEAHRHGRFYPPLPPGAPRPARDVPIKGEGVLGPESIGVSYAVSQGEATYWGLFSATHPRPPEQIMHEQNLPANQLLSFERDKISKEQVIRSQKLNQTRAVEQGYPAEAFEREALFWVYVEAKREEYKKVSGYTETPRIIEAFFRGLAVDRSYVIGLPAPQDIQLANAWKIAYLQRLRREKTDDSYIQAYLKAWNLSEQQVFGNTPK